MATPALILMAENAANKQLKRAAYDGNLGAIEEALTNAAQRGIDISSAIPALKSLESDADETVRTLAQDALKMAEVRPPS